MTRCANGASNPQVINGLPVEHECYTIAAETGGLMRLRVLCTILTLLMTAAIARQLTAQNPPPPPKLFASAADVTAMIAKAKAERKPDQPNFIQPIVGLAPYTANLEHRVAGIPAPASVHEREAEMFYVVEGSGTLVTGGKLKDEKRTNAENLTGSGVDGGTPRKIARGDWVMVPEKTPHWFQQIDGTIVLMSIHLPHAPTTTPSR
jgi:mannose-6-phosphate isomerase-like protein (cupin superfamily)